MSHSPPPKVSIIVPVYKVEDYLPRCLDSILAQAFSDFEVLLIDDGNPDRSGDICEEYAAKDSRIRVFHQANAGVSVARNTGLDNARGEWLSFVDSDDWVEPDWLDVFGQEKRSATAPVDLYLFGFKDIKGTEVLSELLPTKGSFSGATILNSADFYVSPLWRCFIRREIVERYSIRLTRGMKFCEDTEFLLKVLAACDRVEVLDALLYNYLHRTTSATKATAQDFARSSMYLVSINGFLHFCRHNGIAIAQYTPCVRMAYRFFLRNYLEELDIQAGDGKQFRQLYERTCELHPAFKKDVMWLGVSHAWLPSLLLLRAAMIGSRFVRSMRNRS